MNEVKTSQKKCILAFSGSKQDRKGLPQKPASMHTASFRDTVSHTKVAISLTVLGNEWHDSPSRAIISPCAHHCVYKALIRRQAANTTVYILQRTHLLLGQNTHIHGSACIHTHTLIDTKRNRRARETAVFEHCRLTASIHVENMNTGGRIITRAKSPTH